MWFRRRNMGYAKSLKEKKIWTHEGRRKNDEHMKAHILKKKKKRKDSHVSKQQVVERDHIYKKSIVLVHFFPHTCTS